MLYISWYLKNSEYEHFAYEGISHQYFYMGVMDKAKHYNERTMLGKSENMQSTARRAAEAVLEKFYKTENDTENRKDERRNLRRIASPSTNTNLPLANKQINLLPNFTEAQSAKFD